MRPRISSPRARSSSTQSSQTKYGILERLANGPVIGDGSFVVTLERRGYVQAGMWTPEAVVRHPEAVSQLHREFLRAGSDIMQTFTFYSSDDTLNFKSGIQENNEIINCTNINRAACDLAREVADNGDALVAGGISPVFGYLQKKGKDFVMKEILKQLKVFHEKRVDFLLGEFFGHVEEAEWAIESMKELNLPVACSMRIGPVGDVSGVSPQDCAVRMAKAGADIVGINCNYDPFICLETIKKMKEGLQKEGLSPFLMAQPVGWHTHEIRDDKRGYMALPEFPFAMEPRLLTRMEVARFAREAYNLGVRYIGGCCGFEPYHIRAIAEELAPERGKHSPGYEQQGTYDTLRKSAFKSQISRGSREYWDNIVPSTGRVNGKILADIMEDEF